MRYTFPGRTLIDAMIDLSFALPVSRFERGTEARARYVCKRDIRSRCYRCSTADTAGRGDFGAAQPVVWRGFRGVWAYSRHTNTLPLHVEILYNEYHHVAAFSVASLLLIIALFILLLKQWSESRINRLKVSVGDKTS